ncbi:hypothetical protein FAGKG844_70074 [Frankia sp. AgKG'84/4]
MGGHGRRQRRRRRLPARSRARAHRGTCRRGRGHPRPRRRRDGRRDDLAHRLRRRAREAGLTDPARQTLARPPSTAAGRLLPTRLTARTRVSPVGAISEPATNSGCGANAAKNYLKIEIPTI